MKILFAMIFGAAIAIGIIYFKEPGNRPKMDRAGDSISENADEIKDKWNEKVDLDTDKIKEELARSGKVIRSKAEKAGIAISDAASDARITAELKGKLAMESDLSALKISVNTTDGVVTLAGAVGSHEAIQKAMDLALSIDGVTQVISTLQVRKSN